MSPDGSRNAETYLLSEIPLNLPQESKAASDKVMKMNKISLLRTENNLICYHNISSAYLWMLESFTFFNSLISCVCFELPCLLFLVTIRSVWGLTRTSRNVLTLTQIQY